MGKKDTFVLYESSAGYSLFEVVQFEEIGALLEASQENVTDYARFCRSVKLKAFHPFENAEEALDNMNAVSEHSVSGLLQSFLEANMSKKATLGCVESNIATAIKEATSLNVTVDDTVREVLRGVRLHFSKLVGNISTANVIQTQSGLGHSYSRQKIKFNPARSDNMVIQSIALLDQLDKDLNTFAMRVREWYSWHFPELKAIVADSYMYARCAALIQDKGSLFADGSEAKVEKLLEIVGEQSQVDAIIAAAKTSMGMDCSPLDMYNVTNFTQRMVALGAYRKQLALYLSDKMAIVAPNLSTLIGDTVAARLISKAGSLQSLAKAPASTVQILGAEKALFRALKTKGNTPKYGLIYHSSFISRAESKHKGRISRYLANKCSIASRIDSFSDEPNNAYGKVLAEQVEERLAFYESGKAPQKNLDVMKKVARQLAEENGDAMDVDVDSAGLEKKLKKKKKEKKEKKDKKNKEEETPKKRKAEGEETKSEKKKKKKKSKAE
ncbi:hypothetical protein TrVE_jg3942 [Triparma verrucosa]|uniref:Nucleolar protein 56 n=1 Tax=Triparma verrucosa TaxID=1606542 RepID=A0A9W7EQX8_9STRA|nr:hypothetical protein TrVE_jg3942 [Triparma verrucosa]